MSEPTEPNPTQAGKNESAYKEKALPERNEKERVDAWRARILAAQIELNFGTRIKDAIRVEAFLSGKPTDAKGRAYKTNARKIFLGRLEPALQDEHNQTMPGIPTPTVRAENLYGVSLEEIARQFLSTKFRVDSDAIEEVVEDMQWDDDRFGNFILKAEWKVETKDARPADRLHEDILNKQVENALVENLDPAAAEIGVDDTDYVHIKIHAEALRSLPPDSDEFNALDEHTMLHEARMVTIQKEGVHLKRILGPHYVFGPRGPWSKRRWEAEWETMLVSDVFKEGYRNLNPDNLPLDKHDHFVSRKKGYRDLTVSVWHIHDIEDNKSLAIPAAENSGDRFLRDSEWLYDPDAEIYWFGKFRKWDSERPDGLATGVLCLPILEELADVEYYIQRHVAEHADYKTLIPKGGDSKSYKDGMSNPDKGYVLAPTEIIAGVKEHKPPPIPDTLLQRREQLENDLRRLIGTDAQDTGEDHDNPITATESLRRGLASDTQTTKRQKVVAAMLSWYARTLLRLHKDKATMQTGVKTQGPMGVGFEDVDPREFPDSFTTLVDVHSETDQAKALSLQKTNEIFDKTLVSQVPVDTGELLNWYLEQRGEPDLYERIRLPAPEGPENIQPVKGQPGTPNAQEGVLPFPKKAQENTAPGPQSQVQGA